MNNTRRKGIDVIRTRLEELVTEIELVHEEETEYMENMPENLWGSVRYETAEEACENLDQAKGYIEDAMELLVEAMGG